MKWKKHWIWSVADDTAEKMISELKDITRETVQIEIPREK